MGNAVLPSGTSLVAELSKKGKDRVIATNSTNAEGLIQFDSITTPDTYIVKIVQVTAAPPSQGVLGNLIQNIKELIT